MDINIALKSHCYRPSHLIWFLHPQLLSYALCLWKALDFILWINVPSGTTCLQQGPLKPLQSTPLGLWILNYTGKQSKHHADFRLMSVIRQQEMSLRNAVPLIVNRAVSSWCRWFGYFTRVHKEFICVQSVINFLIISTNVVSNNLIITSVLRWSNKISTKGIYVCCRNNKKGNFFLHGVYTVELTALYIAVYFEENCVSYQKCYNSYSLHLPKSGCFVKTLHALFGFGASPHTPAVVIILANKENISASFCC